jgi:hypothetical protein
MSWETLTLTAGVPLKLVQKVTGHKTAEGVLKHYLQPGREEFRWALQAAMPKLLTNGQKTPKDQIVEILDRISAKTMPVTRSMHCRTGRTVFRLREENCRTKTRQLERDYCRANSTQAYRLACRRWQALTFPCQSE